MATQTSSTRPGTSPMPSSSVNTQTKLIDAVHGRILCIADVRGKLSSLNDMAREANAQAIIHTGDFGFFETSSLSRINDRTLKHLTQYAPLIPNAQRASLLAPDTPPKVIRDAMSISMLSEFPLLLSGQIKLAVPVFTVWGACEDVEILERFRTGAYAIENLHVLDEATTRCLDIGGVKLRLLGLGGAFVPHKMFDNGDGNGTVAGGQGTMWTTALQMGELVDTAQRVYDATETRLLVTHASPGREGILTQLALVLKADLTLSAGLHFRYSSSWNEFSVQGDFEGFRHKIQSGKESFDKIWESVKHQVETVVDANQRILLEKALSVIERVPAAQPHIGTGGTATGDEPAWKNCWNWNLCDASYGSLVLDIKEGRVNAELKSQGFNYAYRRSPRDPAANTPGSVTSNLPNAHPNASGLAHSSAAPSGPPAVSNGASAAATPPPNWSHQQQPSLSNSVKENGNATLESPIEKTDKGKGKKGGKSSAPTSGKATPDVAVGDDGWPVAGAVPASPVVANSSAAAESKEAGGDRGTGSAGTGSGTLSPANRKPARHPWTLFMRFQGTFSDAEVREFYGEAKDGITRINFPPSYGKSRTAFVEFGDEEAMRAGLEKHADKMRDIVPYVSVASERPGNQNQNSPNPNTPTDSNAPSDSQRGTWGRGRGRGRGSGFAARGFASAGLTRGGPPGGEGRGGGGNS